MKEVVEEFAYGFLAAFIHHDADGRNVRWMMMLMINAVDGGRHARV